MSYAIYNGKYALYNGKYGILASATPPATYPTDQLIARYAVAENLNDSYGTNHLSVLSGTPVYADGKVSGTKGFDLSPRNWKCYKDGFSVFNGTNANSVSFWFNATSGDWNTNMVFGISFTYNTSQEEYFYFNSPSADIFSWRRGSGTGSAVRQFSGVSSGWHHWVCVFSGNSLNLYKDTVASGTISSTFNMSSGTRFMFGGLPENASSYPALGIVNAFYIYNKALSTSEISQLYNGGAGV
jgi:hypothetical protein